MREKDSFPTSLSPMAKPPPHRPANWPRPLERSLRIAFEQMPVLFVGFVKQSGKDSKFFKIFLTFLNLFGKI